MRETPIPLRQHEVRAILAGKQTQLRRRVQSIPWKDGVNREFSQITAFENAGNWRLAGSEEMTRDFRHQFGAPGDSLWGRESYVIESNWDVCSASEYPPPYNEDDRPTKWEEANDHHGRTWSQPHYRATDQPPELDGHGPDGDGPGCRWRSGIFMPRWASRILLEIERVTLQRITRMKDADAIACGCPGGHDSIPGYYYSATPQEQFWQQWLDRYGADSWAQDTWAWVIDFKRMVG